MGMPTLRRLACLLISVALVACQAPAPRQDVPPVTDSPTVPPVRFERQDRNLAVDATVRQLWIRNPHGSIALRQTSAASVGLHEVVQRIGAEPEAPRVRFEREGDRIVLDVSYASDATLGADARIDGFPKGRVDATLFVPAQLTVDVETTHGAIQARRIDNDLVARSRSGRIMAAGGGAMTLASESGIVRAFPTAEKWSRPLAIETVSGDILIELFQGTDLAIDARTQGVIRVAGSVVPTSAGEEHRYVQGKAGPNQSVVIRSRSGTIEIVEVPRLTTGGQ